MKPNARPGRLAIACIDAAAPIWPLLFRCACLDPTFLFPYRSRSAESGPLEFQTVSVEGTDQEAVARADVSQSLRRLDWLVKLAQRENSMRKLFEYGGIAASMVLIAFGVGSIVVGFNGRDKVRGDLAREKIVGTPDSSIPGQRVDTGSEAEAFADVMRKDTLEATGGRTYAEMGRFLDRNGKETSDEKLAAKDRKTGEPVANPERNIWVTATALSTALNTAYFAESVSVFAIVMGFALLLTGIGFFVLTIRLLRPLTRALPQPGKAVAVPS